MKLDKNFINNPLYVEVEKLCNEIPINKVLEKMLEILNGFPGSTPQDEIKRLETLHYELTKIKKCLDYAKEMESKK